MFAEPYLLLSQIHWAHDYGSQPKPDAIRLLRAVQAMNSAQTEFLTNLGVLLYTTAGESAKQPANGLPQWLRLSLDKAPVPCRLNPLYLAGRYRNTVG